ncbi:hypothetical protein N7490_011921 [Penicillium lividum]|nr:hypothetical protein N7490_011921 [Penicillium lividum]
MTHTERLGLSPVYARLHKSVIFVHGLRGHPRSTWEYVQSTESNDQEKEPKEKKSILRRLFRPSAHVRPVDTLDETGRGGNQRQRQNSIFWPKDSLPKVVPRVNIFTYGYNADVIEGVFQSNNRNSVIQHANDFMVKLGRDLENDAKRTKGNEEVPIKH